ncbi:PQQ-binding-like beta-propeller repeat protein [Streptomyces lavendulocolor]|uniref:outer membrane protein assembly factor BamB family protein n=1 Tax=Streptomyces lavendulocolor TaxID=67316 RepID=UPI003C2AED02
MNTPTGRKTARSFTVIAALALILPACDSSSPKPPAAEKGKPTARTLEIAENPTWTAAVKGDRSCPNYTNDVVVDGGISDVTVRDAATGKTKWSYKKGSSCPLITKEAVFVGMTEGQVASLDLSTGKQKDIWDVPTLRDPNSDRPEETPTALHFLFDGHIYTVNKSLTENLWDHEETTDMWVTEMATYGPTLVLATKNGNVKALSGKDGKLLWTYATPSHGLIEGTIAVTDEAVYFSSRDASVYALSLSTGKRIWATELTSLAWGPSVSGNLVITGDGYHVYGLDKKTGKEKWRYDSNHGYVLTAGGQVFFPETDTGKVTALDAATGELVTNIPAPGAYRLAASPTHLYIWTPTSIQAHKITKRTPA